MSDSNKSKRKFSLYSNLIRKKIMRIVLETKIVILFIKIASSEARKYLQSSKYLRLSIVGIFKNKLDNKNIYAVYLVLIATALYTILGIFWEKFEINIYFILGTSTYVFLFYLNSFLVNFRIRKGFYGGNEFEAREIINFIEQNSDNIDFSDGDSPKKLFNEEDLKEIEKEIMIELNGLPQSNI